MDRLIRFAGLRVVAWWGWAALVAGCTSVSLDEPIDARTWYLTNLKMQPVVPSAQAQNNPQLVFDASLGRVEGSGGCNRISGSYQREGYFLKIGPLTSARQECPNAGRAALEKNFLLALQATARYRFSGSELELLDARGQSLAKLSSMAPP